MRAFSMILNFSSLVKTNTMVHIREENLNKGVTRLALTNSPERFIIDRENHDWIDHGTSWHPRQYRDDKDDGCIPLGDWQNERNILSCNLFHEINLESESLHHIGAGSFRDAWSFEEYDGSEKVLKTLKWKDELDWDEFEEARKEAMAMAQLSGSQYVLDIYGYCSHSAIIEKGEGILWTLFDSDDDNDDDVINNEPSKEERLQIARDVAMAVADSQNVRAQNNVERTNVCCWYRILTPPCFMLLRLNAG
jgi:hypothetical protein